VNRREFEQLRDLPGKSITGPIRFTKSKATSPLLTAEARIDTGSGPAAELRLNINYNPQTGAKTFNVVRPGDGPICRLDVDGPAHAPCGRSHKHSLQTDLCPNRNLPDGVLDRPDLSGRGLRALFAEFCGMAQIAHDGMLVEVPDET